MNRAPGPKAQRLKPVYACALAAALLVAAAPAHAQYAEGPQQMSPPSLRQPDILKRVGIDQKIGQQLPLDLMFQDEAGRDVRLGAVLRHAAGGAGARLLTSARCCARRCSTG